MALPSFPAPPILPRPSSKFIPSKTSGVITTKFESGTTRQRDSVDDRRRTVKIQFELTQSEFQIFQSWWYYKIANGAAEFLIELYLDTGVYQEYNAIAVGGKYSAPHYGVGNFRVSFNLLVTSEEYMDEAALDAILGA